MQETTDANRGIIGLKESENTFANRAGTENPATELEALSPKAEDEGDKVDFCVGLNKKVLPSKYKEWIGQSSREQYLKTAKEPKFNHAVNELYRAGSFIGDGGTADVIRFERETGVLPGRKDGSHDKQILLINLTTEERKLAEKILQDMKNAIGGN